MKKILVLVFALFLSTKVFAADFDIMTNDIKDILNKATEIVSSEMKKHMGFYTGSGNVFPANTSGFPGIKFGIGGGVVLTSGFFNLLNNPAFLSPDTSSLNVGMIDDLSSVAAGFFFPYNMLYGKIGIPGIDLDVGLRVGYFPRVEFGGKVEETSYKIGYDSFHFGLEGRYLIFKDPTGIIKVDARLSGDFDYGNVLLGGGYTTPAYVNNTVIGTNENTLSFNYQWGGSSIGLKVVGGLNIPLVGSIFAGLGCNLNLGAVKTTMGLESKFIPTTGPEISYKLDSSSEKAYDLFDLRLMVGLNLFFINLAYEYNIMNGDMAFTFIPIAITF